MANTYLHGAYGEVGKTIAQSAIQAGTIPVYIGTAPVNLVRGYSDKGILNHPVKLTNYRQAVAAVGYSKDWDTFTLCEAITAHFSNPLGNVGPIYVIPVIAADATKTDKTATLTFVNKRAEFINDKIILDTFAIADKAEGIDYTLDYDFNTAKVIVTLSEQPEGGTVSATYKELSGTIATEQDIVGGKTAAGEYTGIAAAELLYNNENQVGTLYAAPGWSHIPSVRNALVTACQKMNGHWYGYCFTDIPVDSAETIAAAITWKQQNTYTSEYETPCWPMVIDNEGRKFHLSTLSVWRQQLVDFSHDSVPFETASNKQVPGVRQYFGTASANAGYDKVTANELNEKGIRTVCPFNGQLVLWGGHTGAYIYGATSDARQIFDTNVRMIGYIANSFQREWGSRIDEPMTLQLKDEIINREQDKLDALVAQGALIGSPTVEFLASENSTSDMINGDFRYDHIATPTPQFKSATVTVSYTDAGFSVYTAEE